MQFAPCALGVALLCAAPSPARAQSPAVPAPSPTPLTEIGRIVTSDRQDEPNAATAKVTYVVTKAEMLEHGDDSVAAAVSRVPGVLVQHLGGPGSLATVSIRGSRTDGVLVLLDGRPIAGGGIGAVDLGSLPTAGIDRIEVVAGSGATLYGNDASGGVINIITAAKPYPAPIVSVTGGSYGYGRVALETGTFSFAREIAANGYRSPFLPAGAARVNADLSATSARVSDGGWFGNVRVSGSAGFVSRMLGVPGPVGALTVGARQHDDQQDARLSLALRRPRATTTLDVSGSRETVAFLDPLAAEFGPTLDFSTDARVQAGLRNNVASGRSRLVYGIDLANGAARNDGGNGAFAATPYAQTAAYVQEALDFGNGANAYAGLRAERDGGAGGAISPSLGALVPLSAALALRVNAGTAFRVPTAADLQFPGFSNPFLQPERMQSFDATLEAARGSATLGWFVQTGTNLIEVNPFLDFTQPFGPSNEPVVNAPQSSIGGIVFTLASPVYAGLQARFNVTDTYRALQYGNGMPASRLPYRPVFAGVLDLAYAGGTHERLSGAGLTARSVGAMNGNAGDYTAYDAYVRLRLAPHALLSLRVFNIGNRSYEDIDGYPMPGRTFRAELSTR